MDIAASIQSALEEVILRLTRSLAAETAIPNLCLAGGVALNCVANGKVLRDGHFKNIWIQPAAGDAGGAVGAALSVWHQYLGNPRTAESVCRGRSDGMRAAFLGPEFSNEEVRLFLDRFGAKYRLLDHNEVAETTARLLAEEKVIGWFQGRMEFGPRALGSRSILADPRDPEMNAKVNNAVKFREWWRPFAPSLLSEVAGEYLEAVTDSPFMILTAQVKPEKRRLIPSVTHVDGSARPQTVERDVNPLYWRLIHEFGERTGIPVVMNTSFNLRGEPIVCAPTDAVRTFFSSGMDALVIGSFVVEK